jgi:hypothetical protein
MTRRRRLLLCAAGVTTVVAVAAAAAWHWQSELIGVGARWYLMRTAARDEANGDLSRRRQMVTRVNRTLFMAPPADDLVPELFDFITAVSSRVASGQIDFAWAAHAYTSYLRDLVRDRPTGRPRRSMADVEAAVDAYVRFYHLQRRPDVPGVRVRDLAGAAPSESYTVEEIQQAARQGRDLSRP